jgi:2-methylcitrate dehydratase PrpD
VSLATAMAARLVDFRNTRRTSELTHVATRLAIDLVGVTLSGSTTLPAARLHRALGLNQANGDASVLGTSRRTGVLDAAMANGTAAHAEDFDDFNEAFGGHPTVAVLPAILALAEARDFSGSAVLDAYAAGVEVESKIADAVHFHHYEKGWHPTSTLGVFGAAAGAAHLLHLDVERTATALSIAASLSSGIKANFGADTKPMHAGHCNRSGLMAALLAEQGFTAGAATFEGPQGYLNVYNGEGNYDVGPLTSDWFLPPKLLVPGVSIKQFPCCGSTHSAIYAAMALAREDAVNAGDVEQVDVLVHPRRLPHTNKPRPQTPLEAKFSIQYVTARALLDGQVRAEHFEGAAYAQESVSALTARVNAQATEQFAAETPHGFAARVSVSLKDGRSIVREYMEEPGRGPGNPMDDVELRAKFEDCAALALRPDGIDAVWQALMVIEDMASVRELTREIAAHCETAAH